MKLLRTEMPSTAQVAVRVLTGPDADGLSYAGSLVLPAVLFEQLIDVLVFGAYSMQFPDGKLQVRFGQDDQPGT